MNQTHKSTPKHYTKMHSLIGDFYERLLMRDILGKIIPGMCVLIAVVIASLGLDRGIAQVKEVTLPLIFFGIGMSWIIAFALQYIGEKVKLLKQCPKEKSNQDQTQEAYEKKTVDKKRDEFYLKLEKFHEKCNPWQKLHAERLLVIKEACGNGGIALIIAGFLFIMRRVLNGVSILQCINGDGFYWYGGIALLCVGIVLILMHRKHVDRHGIFVNNVIK